METERKMGQLHATIWHWYTYTSPLSIHRDCWRSRSPLMYMAHGCLRNTNKMSINRTKVQLCLNRERLRATFSRMILLLLKLCRLNGSIVIVNHVGCSLNFKNGQIIQYVIGNAIDNLSLYSIGKTNCSHATPWRMEYGSTVSLSDRCHNYHLLQRWHVEWMGSWVDDTSRISDFCHNYDIRAAPLLFSSAAFFNW